MRDLHGQAFERMGDARAVSELLRTTGFLVGFAVAVACAAPLLVVSHVGRKAIVVAIAAIVGTLAGFAAEHRWSWSMLAAVVLRAAGVELTRARGFMLAVVGAIPGAIALAWALPNQLPDWAGPVLALATTIGAV